MKWILYIGLAAVFLTNSPSLWARSTHSKVALAGQFKSVALICTEHSLSRAASVAIGPKLFLTAAHIFFNDAGAWRAFLEKHGPQITTSHMYEIDGFVLQEKNLQSVFINGQKKVLKKLYIPLAHLTAVGMKPVNYDLAIVELEEPHNLPITPIYTSGETGTEYTIVGFGPPIFDLTVGKKNNDVCLRPVPTKYWAQNRGLLTKIDETWKLTGDKHTVPNGRSGTTKGDSGGPLLNSKGQILGISSYVLENTGPNNELLSNYTSSFMALDDEKIKDFLSRIPFEQP
ncbi:MAG: trypsin-like serine protease [Bdellovibrionales bacterium]